MATNLLQFAADRPYLHSKSDHFLADAVSYFQNPSGTIWAQSQINEVINTLSVLESQLQSKADSFLAPWGNSYKAASQDLFFSKGGENEKFHKQFLILINSQQFIQKIKSSIKNIELQQKFYEAVKNQSLDFIEPSENISLQDYLGDFLDKFFKTDGKIQFSGKKAEELVVKDFLSGRKFSTKKANLVRDLIKQLKKGTPINTKQITADFEKMFLNSFGQEEQAEALQYWLNLKKEFEFRLRKIANFDSANISGEVGENLSLTAINSNEISFIFESGDVLEENIVAEFQAAFGQNNQSTSQDGIMVNGKYGSGQKSGSDWILVNKNNVIIRAQVKNSTDVVTRLSNNALNYPQIIKIQNEIQYEQLKRNLNSNGGSLTDQDWEIIDYLIANMLWFSTAKDLSGEEGSAYNSSRKGYIKTAIERAFSSEIAYFLGIEFNLIDDKIQTVIGASNVFFVLDSMILYPTYLIIREIKEGLIELRNQIVRLQVTLGNSFTMPMSNQELYQRKINAAQGTSWSYGDDYSDAVLEVGKEAGENLLSGYKISRINLTFDMNTIMQRVQSKLK